MGPRTGRVRPGDALLAGSFAVAAAVEALVRYHAEPGALALSLGGAVTTLVLVVRRRRPLLATTVMCAGGASATWVQESLLDGAGDAFVPILTLMVLCYALGAHGGRRAVLLGAPQPIALIVVVDLLEPGQDLVNGAVFASTFVVLLPLVAGRLVRSRRRLVVELRELERAAAVEHGRTLRRVRAEQSVAVAQLLGATVESGLEHLLAADDIGEVERRARALLATTRDTVVGLARSDAEPAIEPAPVPGPRPAAVDEATAATWSLLVAAAVGAGLVAETSSDWASFGEGLVLVAAVLGAILLMGRRPLVGGLLTWMAASVMSQWVVPLGDTLSAIGIVVGVPFLALWLGGRVRGTVVVLLGVAGVLVGIPMDDPAGALVLSGLAAVAGGILRDRSALLAELHAGRAEMADRRRDELEVARLEERAALGRELHDSLGHALTVIALQAGAARRLEADDPAAAAAARETIAETATRALHDARGGFSAGAHDVGDLVATARAAGVPTRVTGPAPPPELAPVVFRVVQEALTNVMRHAPGSPVEICFLGPEDRSGYACTVTNPLPPATARRTTYPSAGRGLAGLRSRVEEVGGVADWRAADGRFSLEVRFPAPVGARA